MSEETFPYRAPKTKELKVTKKYDTIWRGVCGLLLCCSSFFQRLDVTEERKRGQNRVKFILLYSLAERV